MTRLYPGMLDSSKEYFNSGHQVMMIHDGQIKKFEDVPEHPELASIIESETDLRDLLNKWFPNDQREQLKTLAKCRFGALNFYADFNDDESSTDHLNCPFRGKCEGENIVCKPLQINGETVSEQEIAILKEVCSDETNTAIASKLGYPLGTFNVKKTNLYQKLGLKTKQQAALTLFFEGLL